MRAIDRRQLGQGLVALSLGVLARPRQLRAAARGRVVIIGGGPGGATIAKYVARDSQGAINVTLIEPAKEFITCFHSNLYLGDFRPFESITHSYSGLAKYGVNVVHEAAATINRNSKTVRLASGATLPYDRLVVAPGIDIKFDSVPGYSEAASEIMPHAWKAGPQTKLLKKQLDSLKDGDLIVMVAPPNPYRCPPGPYERASMMAHVLKGKGHKNTRIIILDPKSNFSKQALFAQGWEKHYPGMVEWQDPKMHGGIKSVDPKSMTVKTDLAEYKAQRQAIPEDLSAQFPLVDRLFDAFRITTIRIPGYEADDIIGTLACKAERQEFTTWMVTPDKDFQQLVTDKILIYKPGRQGSQPEILGVPEVLQRWQISNVEQVIDILNKGIAAVEKIARSAR